MPKALIVLLSPGWLGAARLPRALQRAGWQVASLCPPGNLLAHSRFAGTVTVAASGDTLWADLLGAVQAEKPDVLIPGCEGAVRFFQRVVASARGQVLSTQAAAVLALVRAAVGAGPHHHATLSKTAMHALCLEWGLAVPRQLPVRTAHDAITAAASLGYPLVLKGEHGFAGQQVRICRNPLELLWAHQDLHRAHPGGHIDAQQYVHGTVAMCAGAAKGGSLLDSVFALKRHTYPGATGPCSVFEFADDARPAAMLATLVRQLGFTGLCSLDLMVEEGSGNLFVLELNPRPVPLSSLGHLAGHDLCEALARAFGGEHAGANPDEGHRPQFVALFPNEWTRNPDSPWLHTAHHDVPWDDPPLLSAIIASRVL